MELHTRITSKWRFFRKYSSEKCAPPARIFTMWRCPVRRESDIVDAAEKPLFMTCCWIDHDVVFHVPGPRCARVYTSSMWKEMSNKKSLSKSEWTKMRSMVNAGDARETSCLHESFPNHFFDLLQDRDQEKIDSKCQWVFIPETGSTYYDYILYSCIRSVNLQGFQFAR